jgi:hypothetical protein
VKFGKEKENKVVLFYRNNIILLSGNEKKKWEIENLGKILALNK